MISRHILIPSNNALSRSTTKNTCRLAGRRCFWFSFRYYLLCTRLLKVFLPSLKCVFFLVPKKFLGILFYVPGRCAPNAITNSKYKETKLSVAALNGRRVFACISWHRAYIKYTPITPRRRAFYMNYSLYREERERDMGTIRDCNGLDGGKQLNTVMQCWSRRKSDGDDDVMASGEGRKISFPPRTIKYRIIYIIIILLSPKWFIKNSIFSALSPYTIL